MNDTEIKIIISGEDVQGTPASPERVNEPNAEQPTAPKKTATTTTNNSVGVLVGTQIAKQAVAYASSRVGEWTGNTQAQRMIDMTGQMLTYGIAIAVNPVIGLTMLGLNVGTNIADFAYNRSKENLSLEVLKQRAGTETNRSR